MGVLLKSSVINGLAYFYAFICKTPPHFNLISIGNVRVNIVLLTVFEMTDIFNNEIEVAVKCDYFICQLGTLRNRLKFVAYNIEHHPIINL